jgi:pilus assembly protein FimV
MDDNPAALALGGGLVALLAGFGVYRFTKRKKKDSGETSFLESRLQPDSFFGASGGQRIDTRDAGTASSSMSYSLSQLDAIGDVDPVAEADVYLAYGRDLQAEEILKEAMRGSPERMAIRTKLLEVYAKRRDTKGFELLATQLYALTRGEGEDWAKAQTLGAQIDPENALYQAGGAPALAHGQPSTAEPLGASTMPQSVLPSPSQYGAARTTQSPFADSASIDLDLDLGGAAVVAPEAATPYEATQTLGLSARPDTPAGIKTPAPSARAPQSPTQPSDFDLSGITLDLDASLQSPEAAKAAVDSSLHFDLPSLDDDGAADPVSRKLELAEEFRQIGDLDGARDLLQEVVAKSTGAVKARAQGMLDELG